MRTTRLAFNDLQNGFDVIAKENLRSIKGGVAAGDPQWEYAISPNGTLFWRPAGTEDWNLWGNLNTIVVTATRTYVEPPVFDYNNYSLIPPNSGGGVAGSSGGNGNASNGISGGTMLVSGQAGATAFDIFSLMNGALGISATAAATSASIAKLESQMAFATTSKIFGVLDVLSNVYEIAYSEEDMNHKLEDGAQALIGIALIFTGPVGAIVGGVALGAWEIYEYYRDHQPVTAE